jgi:hypothetical protein
VSGLQRHGATAIKQSVAIAMYRGLDTDQCVCVCEQEVQTRKVGSVVTRRAQRDGTTAAYRLAPSVEPIWYRRGSDRNDHSASALKVLGVRRWSSGIGFGKGHSRSHVAAGV